MLLEEHGKDVVIEVSKKIQKEEKCGSVNLFRCKIAYKNYMYKGLAQMEKGKRTVILKCVSSKKLGMYGQICWETTLDLSVIGGCLD